MAEARQFTVRISGMTPLLMHNNVGLMGPREDKGRDKLQWEKDHYLDSVYKSADGASLVLPAHAIRKAAIQACRFVTDKPKGASFKSFGPLIEATLFVLEDAVLSTPIERVIQDVRIVNLDPSKGPRGPRGPRCRPMIPLPWEAGTLVALSDEAITDAHLEKILDAAGRYCGFLDGRAIGMGRAELRIKRV